MRLTNVTQMALPPGRLLSFAVSSVGEPGEEFVVSFDQGRHVGQGQRPGSWMAVAARLPEGTSLDQLAQAWQAVQRRHGSLHTGFRHDSTGIHLNDIALTDGDWIEHPLAPGQDPRTVLRELFDAACAPFQQPSHRLAVVIPEADGVDQRPLLILGADHCHVDMWSFLVILRDLNIGLADGAAGRQPCADLPPAASFAEHSALLAAKPSAPEHIHQRWREILAAEGGVMPTFPLPLGELTDAPDPIVEVRDLLDADGIAALSSHAHARGVRLLPLAVSVMTEVTAEQAGVPLRAVLPVHSRDEDRWRNSVGWYITNAVLESADADPAACRQAVREAIALGSYPLGPILEPYGGMPVAPGMFAISWLDTRRLPELGFDAEVQYVSAVVRDDGVMVWFIAADAGLHLRARYPDTEAARRNVGRWLDTVAQRLGELAKQ